MPLRKRAVFGQFGEPLEVPLFVHACVLSAALISVLLIGVPGLKAVWWSSKVRRANRRGGSAPMRDFAWDSRGISDRGHEAPLRRLGGLVALALVMVALCWRLFVSDSGHWTIAIGFIVLVVALFAVSVMTLMALPAFLTHRRGRLAFNQFPFHPGDRLSVEFSPNKYPNPQFTLRYVDQASLEDTRAYEGLVIRYSARSQPAVHALDRTVHIEFDLPDVPDYVTEMSAPAMRYWELRVEVHSSRYDYETSFPLPVYAREEAA